MSGEGLRSQRGAIHALQARVGNLEASRGGAGASLEASTDSYTSDFATLTFDGADHQLTWGGLVTPPSWLTLSGSTIAITEPGMYAGFFAFANLVSAPTVPGLVIETRSEMAANYQTISAGEIYAASNPSPPSGEVDVLALAASDMPWTLVNQRVWMPTDATGRLDVYFVIVRLAEPGGSGVESVVAGSGITVNATDPANPVVSATGGGHAVAVADSGGTVTADVSTVEFTGTAVTSVTDDGSGHTTVTVDQGAGGGLTVTEPGGAFTQTGVVGLMFEGAGITVTCTDDGADTVLVTVDNSATADQITVTANLNSPGGFTYPYGTLDIRGDDNHVSLTLTSLPLPLAAGEGFSAQTTIATLSGIGGTLTTAYAELDVTNLTCDERLSTYTSVESAPAAGIHDVTYDTTDTGTKIGTDLSSDGTTTTSAAGGVFAATLSIEMYITP